MSEDMANNTNSGSGASRREALRALGAGPLLAVIGAASPGAQAGAQEATPQSTSTFEGRYAVIRIRQVRPEYSAEELARTVRDGFLPIVRDVPGFVAYFVIANEEARTWVSIGIFADKAGSDESTERAIAFGQRGTHDWVEPDPIIVDGVIGAAALSL
ncbi:MAG: hypothetical protein M3457_13545 [Chloroflexota bacterium]|nr:hypothetical protein [Chloroflexota bacterium]